MQILLKSSTTYVILFFMTDSTDHVSAKTGLSPTVTISKNGAAFGSPAGAVTEIANGWYKIAGNATDTNTAGPLAVHATGTGADPYDGLCMVTVIDINDAVRGGLTAMPNANAGANGGLPTGDASGHVAVSSIDANVITATAINANAITAAKIATDAISSAQLAAAGVTKIAAAILSNTSNLLLTDSTGRVTPIPSESLVLHTGTAQAGGASTITLAAGASAVDNYYRGARVRIHTGTGIGQVATITGYVGSTKVATVDLAWATAPDNTSQYSVMAIGSAPRLDTGLKVDILAATITAIVTAIDGTSSDLASLLTNMALVVNILNSALAASVNDGSPTAGSFVGSSALVASNDFYIGSVLCFTSGALQGKAELITAYNGSTKLLTFATPFPQAPANTDKFIITGRIQ